MGTRGKQDVVTDISKNLCNNKLYFVFTKEKIGYIKGDEYEHIYKKM